MRISRVGQVRCTLGEGPLWDVEQQALYFTDVLGKTIWRYDPATNAFDKWELPFTVSSLALCADGNGAVIATSEGLHVFQFSSGKLRLIVDPTSAHPNMLLNDGKADRSGRFVVGSVDTAGGEIGTLFRLDPDETISEIDRGFGISNGPCWGRRHHILCGGQPGACHLRV